VDDVHKKIFFFEDNSDEIKKNDTKQQIMMVDDNLDLIEMVKKGFHRISDGYAIMGVTSGVECFDLLASGFIPELIILDIMMPGMKGWDVIERLKRNSKWKDIPVVFLTAKADSDSKKRGMEIAEDYITKPFKIIDLKQKIDKILNL